MKNTYFTLFLASLLTCGCLMAAGCGGGTSTQAATQTTAGPATAVPNGSTPATAERPADREVTIPAGTSLPITLDSSVGSDTSTNEDAVAAHLSHAVTIGGDAVLPAGSRVSGVVTDATRSGKVKGLAHVAVRFNTITPAHGEEKYRMTTATIKRTAQSTKKKDAVKIGAPAAGGAIIGGILGGGKGALIGTAVGAGAGTAVVMSTRGEEVHLPKGSALTLKLSEPLTIRVRG